MNIYPWQQHQWRRFVTAHDRGRVPHALLLSGPRGIGLAEFAFCVSARVLCHESPADGVACGKCKPCVLYRAGNHPDFILVTPAESTRQIRVDAVRDLIDLMHLKSQYEHFKVAIIDPAEAMNRSAANSLLKTLEEPPPASLLILCTHNTGRVPITIRSRCQRLEFHGALDAETAKWLTGHIPDGPYSANELLDAAAGSPLLARELAQSGLMANLQEVLNDLASFSSSPVDPVRLASKWSGFGARQVLEWLLGCSARMARLKLLQSAAGGKNSSLNNHLQQIADELDLSRLVAWHELVMRNYLGATGAINLNIQGLLEEIIIQWQAKES